MMYIRKKCKFCGTNYPRWLEGNLEKDQDFGGYKLVGECSCCKRKISVKIRE